MDALQVLIEEGNKAKSKKTSEVTPATTLDQPLQVNGQAPKHIVPSLFQKAKRKNNTIKKALDQSKWISHVSPIQSLQELQEFIALWEGVNGVNRSEDANDEITWRLTVDDQYTTQSAYRIQFVGRRKKPTITPIWKAQAELKCRIFAWIIL
jgi:hypothetical protein